MFIRIEPDSDIPIYTQLTNQIIEGIAKGDIKQGDSLPSVRALASDFGVNMHTVNKSYHLLEKKGIIHIQPKSGAIISLPNNLDENEWKKLKEEFRPLIAESLVRGLNEEDINELIRSIIHKLKK